MRLLLLICAAFSLARPAQKPAPAASRVAPDFAANRSLAETFLQSGRTPRAIPYLEAAHRIDAHHHANTAALALAYIQTGSTAKAKPLIEELRSAGQPVANLEGHQLNAAGNIEGAALAFQRAAEADPSEDNLFDLANHLLNHNGFVDSRKILRWGLERFPKSARLHVTLGVAEYSLKNYDEAVQSLCAAVDLDPADPRPLTFLGQMIGVSPTMQRPLSQRLGVLARNYPKLAEAQYFYGLSLLPDLDPKKALEMLKRAAVLAPRDARPHLELGKLHADHDRLDEAVKSFQAALQRDPALETAHYRLAQIFQSRKLPHLAAPHLAAYRQLRAARAAAQK